MANRDLNETKAPETDVVLLTGSFVGANGANGTACTGCIVSATRTDEGDYDLVLQDGYPAFLFHCANVANAAGAHAETHTPAPTTKTLKVTGFTAAGAADDCDALTINVLIVARNSTSRRST